MLQIIAETRALSGIEHDLFSGTNVCVVPNQSAWNNSEQNIIAAAVTIPSQICKRASIIISLTLFHFYKNLSIILFVASPHPYIPVFFQQQ